MRNSVKMRPVVPVLILCFLALAAGTYWGAYTYFRAEELERAEARLSLYRSTVKAELERFSHLTYVLSRDSVVIETAAGGDTAALDARFAAFAERAGIDAIYLMDLEGVTRSASNARTPYSFVGQDYSFRPYFKAALRGEQGEFYGIGATTGIPGYFFAEAIYDTSGAPLGVVAIKIDLSTLQESWRLAGERVILANADGVALLASVPEWRYRTLNTLKPNQRERISNARQFGKQPLTPLAWRPGARSAVIDGEDALYLSSSDLPNAWTMHYFASDDPVVTRASLTTGVFLLLAGLMFIGFQVQRMRRIGAALRRSESEEALLRDANARLAVEIDERRSAEQRLQKTQADLERAGRLAALGQLAASVTHELGQPIAAMRNHLAATEIQSGHSPLTERLQGLVDRMEDITRQLKFFSRKGRDKFADVDLRHAMQAALDLVAPNFDAADVTLTVEKPDTPVILNANAMRIEQVMTNLLRNAVDATDGQASREITISVNEDTEAVWFDVSDNGHGLGARSFEDLREPFTTSRESGHGMGLGLTISSGIVDDHGGEMTAWNKEDGGAVFQARFPKTKETQQ